MFQIFLLVITCLGLELLGFALLPLAGDEGQGHNARDVHLRAKDLGLQTQLLSSSLHVLKTLLVVGTGTTDPDLNVVLVQLSGIIPQSTDDTLEGAGNIGEVGNTTTNEENLALVGHGSAEHQVQDSTGIVVGLRLGGSTRVLTIVGELVSETSRGNSIGIDDGSTTTSNQSPDTAVGVQDGKLERGTSLGIHLSNVSLLLGQLTAEGSREVDGRTSINVDLLAVGRGNVGQTQSSGRASDSPLDTALKVSSLVQLGSQVEEVNGGGSLSLVGDDNQRVDLEVGKLAVDVDSVQAGDEVNQDIVNTLGDLLEQSGSNFLI